MMTAQTRKTTVSIDEWKRNLRRSSRVKANFQLEVICNVNGERVLIPGYARNVSSEGIGVFIPANLGIDEKLELQFTLPKSELELTLKGIVRAVDEFFYGIEFLGLDAATKRLLRAFSLP